MDSQEKSYIEIDPARCKGCACCVVACPKDCIQIGSEINQMGYQFARFAVRQCIGCGLCFYTCPEFGAITVYTLPRKGE